MTKINLLKGLLQKDESMSRVLIFVNNKKTADLVANSIEEDFLEQFGIIDSNKSQNYRLNTMASFQRGEIKSCHHDRCYGTWIGYIGCDARNQRRIP